MHIIKDLINSKTFQENDFNSDNEGWQTVTWYVGVDPIYIIKATVNNIVNLVDVGTDSMGEQLYVDGGDIIIDDIISVHDYFDDEVELDEYTKKLILNYLNI
jgi:hypothetical protein